MILPRHWRYHYHSIKVYNNHFSSDLGPFHLNIMKQKDMAGLSGRALQLSVQSLLVPSSEISAQETVRFLAPYLREFFCILRLLHLSSRVETSLGIKSTNFAGMSLWYCGSQIIYTVKI